MIARNISNEFIMTKKRKIEAFGYLYQRDVHVSFQPESRCTDANGVKTTIETHFSRNVIYLLNKLLCLKSGLTRHTSSGSMRLSSESLSMRPMKEKEHHCQSDTESSGFVLCRDGGYEGKCRYEYREV